MAGVREVVGAVRLARTRYLRAWRLWRYDPRYRRAASGKQIISFIEPVRLWWRGELDDYVGRPLTEASRARQEGRHRQFPVRNSDACADA
jgi:hypothetical protein